MPSIKDIARTVILKNWPIGEVAFNALWTSFEGELVLGIPPATGNDQPALAAIGRDTDPAIVAVALFVKALQELVSETTLADLLPLLEEISVKLGHKGIGIRLKKTSLSEFEATTIISAPAWFATAYTHEHPDGIDITKTTALDQRQHPEHYMVFIYHEHDLPDATTGEVYWRAKPDDTPQRPRLSLLQYRILRHLLKHRNRLAQRSLASLVEHCWREVEIAVRLRADVKNLTTKYKKLLNKFSGSLQSSLGIRLQVGNSPRVYELVPWPVTYCVIEEQQQNRASET